jgi:hypothetical protein
VNARNLSTFNRLLLDRISIPTVVVNRILPRITISSTHHGEHGLKRSCRVLLTDFDRRATANQPLFRTLPMSVSCEKYPQTSRHKLTTLSTAREIHETRPEGQMSRRVHLDRWHQRTAQQDQGKLTPQHLNNFRPHPIGLLAFRNTVSAVGSHAAVNPY